MKRIYILVAVLIIVAVAAGVLVFLNWDKLFKPPQDTASKEPIKTQVTQKTLEVMQLLPAGFPIGSDLEGVKTWVGSENGTTTVEYKLQFESSSSAVQNYKLYGEYFKNYKWNIYERYDANESFKRISAKKGESDISVTISVPSPAGSGSQIIMTPKEQQQIFLVTVTLKKKI